MVRRIARAFLFIAVGIITIIVGAFMLQGIMRLWDSEKASKNKDENARR